MNKVFRKSGFFAAALLPSMLFGCAGTDVELNGGLFDLVGLKGANEKQSEPELKDRSTLVVPPSTASLPVPGSNPGQPALAGVAANNQSWPVDPDQTKVQNNAALAAQHKSFCEQARRRYEAGLDSTLANGPLGSCEESILRNFTGKGLFEGGTADESQREPAPNSN